MYQFILISLLIYTNSSTITNICQYFKEKIPLDLPSNISYMRIIIYIIWTLIYVPLTEESTFRFILPQQLNHIFQDYTVIVVNLIFGFIHSVSYFNLDSINNYFKIILTLNQISHTILLGLYLSTINSLWLCILLHGYYNMGSTLITKFNLNRIKLNKSNQNNLPCLIRKRRCSFPNLDQQLSWDKKWDMIDTSSEIHQLYWDLTNKLHRIK